MKTTKRTNGLFRQEVRSPKTGLERKKVMLEMSENYKNLNQRLIEYEAMADEFTINNQPLEFKEEKDKRGGHNISEKTIEKRKFEKEHRALLLSSL